MNRKSAYNLTGEIFKNGMVDIHEAVTFFQGISQATYLLGSISQPILHLSELSENFVHIFLRFFDLLADRSVIEASDDSGDITLNKLKLLLSRLDDSVRAAHHLHVVGLVGFKMVVKILLDQTQLIH